MGRSVSHSGMRIDRAGVPGGRSSPAKGPAKGGVTARQVVVAAAGKGKPREERRGEQNGRQKKTRRQRLMDGSPQPQQPPGLPPTAQALSLIKRGFDFFLGPYLRTTAWNSAHMGYCEFILRGPNSRTILWNSARTRCGLRADTFVCMKCGFLFCISQFQF